MGSRDLVHHGTLALEFTPPPVCNLLVMAGKNSNMKYFECDRWLDDQLQVFSNYPTTGGRVSTNKVCTVSTVTSSRKVSLGGRRNLSACIIADTSSKKTFTLSSNKFSGQASKKAGLALAAISQLSGAKDSCSKFAGKKCCPVLLIQKCNVGISISVLTFLRSVFCSQVNKIAWGLA
jgi:hypothetical protein